MSAASASRGQCSAPRTGLSEEKWPALHVLDEDTQPPRHGGEVLEGAPIVVDPADPVRRADHGPRPIQFDRQRLLLTRERPHGSIRSQSDVPAFAVVCDQAAEHPGQVNGDVIDLYRSEVDETG